MSEAITGGWSNFANPLTAEANHVFKTAVTLVGVGYVPVAFASQLVAGMNYCFLCTTTLINGSNTQGAAKVSVFQPLPGQGAAHVTHIEPILPR